MDDRLSLRTMGLWCAIGGVILTVVAIVSALVPTAVPATDVSAPFSPGVYRITQVVVTVSQVLTVIGAVGLARSGGIGGSRMGAVGSWIAAAGLALVTLFDAVFVAIADERLDSGLGMATSTAIGLSSVVASIGLILAGIAVLRAGRWQGWHRFAPLGCGVFGLVVLNAMLVLYPGLIFWALGGWSACFILLGLALAREGAAPESATLTASPA